MTNITIPLVNQTGLSTSNYKIYVLGFSATSQKYLSVSGSSQSGSFVPFTAQSGTIPSFVLGTDITEILIDTSAVPSSPSEPTNPIDGARIYFFIADTSVFQSPPSITYSNYGANIQNVQNPPNTSVPPYTFTEFTLVNLDYGAVIDSQTVDGFVFPLTIELNSNLGEVGQPLTINRKDILNVYSSFMTGLGSTGNPFQDLEYNQNSGGLLNPGAYLNDISDSGEFNNLTSPLNALFDTDLNTFFTNNNLSIQGVSSGSISADIYTAVSGVQPLPSGPFSHQALQFTGTTNGDKYNIYSPVGLCVLTYLNNGAIAPITGTVSTLNLTFQNPLTAGTPILKNMYVAGAGIPAGIITVSSINTNSSSEITSLDLALNLGQPTPNSNYKFSTNPSTFPSTSYVGSIDSATLTFQNPLAASTPISTNMYVEGTGIPGNVTVDSITYNSSKEIVSVDLTTDLGNPAANSQYQFSKLSDMFLTSGNMVFGNFGVFAYSAGVTGDGQTVLLNLQNQIVSAFNRGIANLSPSSGNPGYSSAYWGTQSNWYPVSSVQNLFSLFMHTGTTSNSTPIFIQASNSVACARGSIMGQSYGFAYDENAGPVPPAPNNQPEVPSKYDPLPSTTTTVTITLGPWS